MDFQGLADQIHITIAETLLRKKNLLHAGVNGTFSFLQIITSSAKILQLKINNFPLVSLLSFC